jgi:hypothetical protein
MPDALGQAAAARAPRGLRRGRRFGAGAPQPVRRRAQRSPRRLLVRLAQYRHLKDDKPLFYELLTLGEERGSLVIRLKHFNPDLTGWEERGDSVSFPFVVKQGGVLHFEGMAFKPRGKNAVTVYLAIQNEKDGSVREAEFHYTRVAK